MLIKHLENTLKIQWVGEIVVSSILKSFPWDVTGGCHKPQENSVVKDPTPELFWGWLATEKV